MFSIVAPSLLVAMGIVRALSACAMLLLGLGSLAYALTGSFGEVERPVIASAPPLYREVPAERVLRTRPIEVMRLGMRALGTNPDRSQVPAGLDEPNAATWRTVVLTMEKPDGGILAIELLRPVAWLLAQEAAAGGTIWLDIEEMAVRGPAQVLEIGPCPEIEQGPGNVVTGRFVHQSAEGSALLDIAFEGADGIEGVTPNHPFWSVDRQEFVRAEELVEGEQVDTAHGRAAVAHVAWRRAGPETLLYNLETHGEHVYRVGQDGVLVHNAGQPYITPSNGPYRGGRHGDLSGRKTRGDKLDSHHMPDQHANPHVDPNDGPAIQMDPPDHWATRSNGRWLQRATQYRAQTAEMIAQGRYRSAMAREILDVRRAAHQVSGDRTKYNEAIREMLDYARRSGQLPGR